MENPAFRLWNRMFPYVSSVAAGSDGMLYASSLGHGVYRIGPNGDWKAMDEMWPENVTVNRLICSGSEVTACTNSGLFTYKSDTC
ncbi:hypothetical protein [Paenibacillus ginsengarvi]|uniref:Uncharacterized protein n=1 Tax=Paenibacillus ginsengarvi TaxID=400777 RepID=A0A3B0BDN8_9BACL|nr:hypothetical protein [Paenibacillus ginsengarvi]RKN71265.1 hypothetical protein D7M11_29670 [Paenibacillus ginsengarvi]